MLKSRPTGKRISNPIAFPTGWGKQNVRPPGLKPAVIVDDLRGAEAPPFHLAADSFEFFCKLQMSRSKRFTIHALVASITRAV